jgi:acetylornithine deacetylase/succinyl-diaminopimelate desuccinylase-like protein
MRSVGFGSVALCALLVAGQVHAQGAKPGEADAAFRALFKEMVETDSSGATGDCTALVNKTAARMRAAGFPAENLRIFVPDGAPKAGNLVAWLPGRDPKAKAVLMLGHIDVVNAFKADWVRDPFVLVEENGQFYGRGVSDMKAQDAIWADNMIRYHAEGYQARRGIKMALTCGEEGGGFVNGAGWLAQNQRELIDAGISLTEGGGGDLDASGRKLAVTVMAAEKGGGNFTLEVTGPGGHSSKPRPDNLIIELGQALANLKSLSFPTELNDFNRPYLTTLSGRVDPETGAAMRKVLTDPQDPGANAILNRHVNYNAILRTTCIPTLIEGGHAPNAQPQRVKATINCRLLPNASIAPAEAAIVKAVNNPDVKVINTSPAAPPRGAGPPLTPQVMSPIEKVAAQVFPGVPVTPMQETFGTDSGRLIAVGIPTYGFSALFRGEDAGNIHGLNEHISVESVMQGREFMYRLIKAYAEQN